MGLREWGQKIGLGKSPELKRAPSKAAYRELTPKAAVFEVAPGLKVDSPLEMLGKPGDLTVYIQQKSAGDQVKLVRVSEGFTKDEPNVEYRNKEGDWKAVWALFELPEERSLERSLRNKFALALKYTTPIAEADLEGYNSIPLPSSR